MSCIQALSSSAIAVKNWSLACIGPYTMRLILRRNYYPQTLSLFLPSLILPHSKMYTLGWQKIVLLPMLPIVGPFLFRSVTFGLLQVSHCWLCSTLGYIHWNLQTLVGDVFEKELFFCSTKIKLNLQSSLFGFVWMNFFEVQVHCYFFFLFHCIDIMMPPIGTLIKLNIFFQGYK